MKGKILDNKYYLVLLIILVLSLGIRLYFYSGAFDQALWYDEADYLLRAKTFVMDHLYDEGLAHRKPVIMPALWSIIILAGGTEYFIKFLQVLISVAGVFAVYKLGEIYHSKETGLIMAALLGMYWLNIFFSFRILLDEAALLWTIMALYFFWKWYKVPTKKDAILAGVAGSMAMMTFYIPLYIPALLVVFLMITKKLSFFRDKTFWYAVGTYAITFLPLMVWWYFVFGDPIFGFNSYYGTGQIEEGYDSGILGFFRVFQSSLLLPMFGAFLLGVGKSLMDLVTSFDLVIKRQVKKLDADLLMLMWLVLVPVSLGIMVVHVEPRYMLPAFVPVFYFIAKAVLLVANLAKKALEKTEYNKSAKVAAIVIILVIFAYTQIGYATSIIDLKSTSFEQERYAGYWLGENMEISEYFMTCNQNVAFQVYSERKGFTFGSKIDAAEEIIKTYQPKYAVLNAYNPDCAFDYLTSNTTLFVPVKIFYVDEGKTQPVTIIYEINYGA